MSETSLRALLKTQQVQAPGVFDCLSGRAAELTGYKAVYLSAAGIAYSWAGVPDMGVMNQEEMFWIASRITDYVPMPVIAAVDTASQSPLPVYHQVQRMAKAGISAFIVDDTNGFRGVDEENVQVVPEKEWLSKVKAAVAACKDADADCMVIARSWAKQTQGMDEAVKRCAAAEKLGADMTGIVGLKTLAEAEQLNATVKGMKLWTNLGVTDGHSDVEPKDIDALNYKLVTVHFLEKGAMFGMLDFANQNNKNGNTVYHDTQVVEGTGGKDYHVLFSFHKKWIPMEDEFLNVKDLCESPSVVKGGDEK